MKIRCWFSIRRTKNKNKSINNCCGKVIESDDSVGVRMRVVDTDLAVK